MMSSIPLYSFALAADDPVFARVPRTATQEDARFRLERTDTGRLQVSDRSQPKNRPLSIDWNSAEARRRLAAGRQQPLARACGLHKNATPRIVDATAGLGTDASCLAGLGARVWMFERHPVLQALLADALDHAPSPLQERLHLLCGSSIEAPWPEADVVFVDPMFPSAGKRAAPGLNMQILQQLVGADDDADALWQRALNSGAKRVVLKRPPRGAKVRLGEPQASYGGGRVVYDVYFP